VEVVPWELDVVPVLGDVLGVVPVGRRSVDPALVHGGDPQALALEATQDLTHQSPADGIGLDQDQGALAHAARPYPATGPAPPGGSGPG